MNKKDRSLLLGMLIGDGCLKLKRHIKKDGQLTTYYEYVISHSVKQRDYLEHKLNVFHSIMGGKKPRVHQEEHRLKGYDAIHYTCRFSRCHKSFKLLHKYLYSNNNSKLITPRVLSYLDAQAIAIWYMDDGCLSKSKNKDGKVISVQSRLYTYFSEVEADTVIKYFNDVWSIYPTKSFYKKNSRWNIRFPVEESYKLEKVIAPYVIPSMYYKLPSNFIPRVLDTLPDSKSKGDDIVCTIR